MEKVLSQIAKKLSNKGIDKRFPFLVGLYKKVYFLLAKNCLYEIKTPLNTKLLVSGKDAGLGLFLRNKGKFEPVQTRLFIESVKAGDTVLDIGANVGYYTILACKLVGRKGKVIAFEPDRKNFELLKMNVEANNCQNVEVVNKAVGKGNGKIFLVSDFGNPGECFTSSSKVDKSVLVNQVSLDEFLRQKKIKKVDTIKIDVEGAEVEVLNGGKETFARNQNTSLFLECNPKALARFAQDPADLVDTLESLGFAVNKIINERFGNKTLFNRKTLKDILKEVSYVSLMAKSNKSTKLAENPLVTVLMTAYNAEKFISLSLKSIINQTYKNLQIIVIDDGSEDGTLEIASDFAAGDKRIEVFKMKKNVGVSIAANFGVEKARGQYLARMDADDISFLDRIEKQVKFFQENPGVVILGGQCVLINEKGEEIGEKRFPTDNKNIYNLLFSFNPIQHPSCIINHRLLPKNFVFYQNRSLIAHDLELLFRLSEYGKLANLPESLLFYRQYPGSATFRNPKKSFSQTAEVRARAVKEYGYRPTLKGLLTCYTQRVLILVLPSALVYPLFQLIRASKKIVKTDKLFELVRKIVSLAIKREYSLDLSVSK